MLLKAKSTLPHRQHEPGTGRVSPSCLRGAGRWAGPILAQPSIGLGHPPHAPEHFGLWQLPKRASSPHTTRQTPRLQPKQRPQALLCPPQRLARSCRRSIMAAPKKIDYDRIEPGWRAGLLSPHQLAAAYTEETGQKVSHAAIIKHFKKAGIARPVFQDQ